MIYTFDKQQNILRVLDEGNFLTAELTLKINEATTFSFTVTQDYELTDEEKYVALPHPLDQTKFIMLRLISRTDNKDDIEYTAYEYAYQELSTSGYIKDTRPGNANALTLMTKALEGSGWSVGRTTVAGTATTNFYYIDYLSAIRKVVDLLGGEIVFYVEITGNKITGRYMDYLFRQGVDTSKVFANGSNLLSVARKKQSDSIYTAILPRGKGEQVSDGGGNEPDGYGRRIDIKDVVWSTDNGNPLNKPAGSFILEDPQATAEYGQANGNARLLIQNFDDIEDPNVLIQQAYNTLMTVNHPLIEYSATVSDVGTLSLGDTVLIMHKQRGLSYKTRVFQVKYDLLNSENTELSLGDNLSNNSITSQINSIRTSVQNNSEQQAWTVSRFGRYSTTFGAEQPIDPKIGDVWFKSLTDGSVEIWRYNGTIWVKVITPTTGEDIAKAVDQAIIDAKAYSDQAIADNNEVVNRTILEVSQEQANLAIQAGDFENKAQAMADKALADAIDNTTREISSVDTKAQEYANQAKADAIAAGVNADGVINKRIDDEVDSISTTISQNKVDADGKITTAQSTATQALNEVKTKVSQTVYDEKTGQLQADLNTTTATATEAKTTINSYKLSNDSRLVTDEALIKTNADNILLRVKTTNYNQKTGEIDGRLAQIDIDVDGITETVTTNKGDITSLATRVLTAEGQITTVNDDISGLESKQLLMAGQITTEVSNRQKGDTNTLTQAKDFTTSSISSYDSNIQTQFTQTENSIIAQVTSDTTTQISLLKDSYSFGTLSDGKLVSGFGGNQQGVYLKGNMITLDGNTTVTGDFYAKGGNFTNLNASNITAGNLDADEVRIINLDVNTLTGDVSRFLETNWDGAYGSTKITSAGMKINTQYIQADFQDFGMDFSYTNQKIGGMGISQYTNGEPGLAMRLESDGAYMAWAARDEGDSTGPYINKLAWYRQGKPGLSGNYGFIFEDYVTFNRPINIEGVDQKLVYQPMNYNGLHPYFGAEGGNSGFTFGNDWIDYMNNGHYYPITRLLTSLSGLGNVAIPTQINSDGTVAGWRNITL